jgi:uncharacterized protein
VGNASLVRKIDPKRYLGPDLGEMTLEDILAELEKPSRDPRGDFTAPAYREDLQKLEDVKEGMVLQGVVTNVTAFGAFVDVGVHQDGLVHVSQLSTRFIKDPSEAVKVGDRLTVKVLTVDLVRKRLALSVRAVTEGTSAPSVGAPRSSGSEARPTAGGARPPPAGKPGGGKAPASQKPSAEPFNNPFRNLKR